MFKKRINSAARELDDLSHYLLKIHRRNVHNSFFSNFQFTYYDSFMHMIFFLLFLSSYCSPPSPQSYFHTGSSNMDNPSLAGTILILCILPALHTPSFTLHSSYSLPYALTSIPHTSFQPWFPIGISRGDKSTDFLKI